MWAIAVANGVPNRGGLTVAAPVRPLHGPRIVRGFRRTACGSPSHGGLTVDAPVKVRLCIAQIVFLPTGGHCYSARSGSGSRPWNVLRMRVRNAEFKALSLHMRFAKTRRADGRCSCRISDSASQIADFANNARRATKSGWRKPAVVPETRLHVNSRYTTENPAPTNPRGADARRSCRISDSAS